MPNVRRAQLFGSKRPASRHPAAVPAGFHIFHVTFGATLFLALNCFVVVYAWRLVIAIRSRKRWSLRRKRAVQMSLSRGLVVDAMLVTYIIQNALVLSNSAWFCRAPLALTLLSLLRGLGWNTVLLMLVIDGHSPVPHPVRPAACLPLERESIHLVDLGQTQHHVRLCAAPQVHRALDFASVWLLLSCVWLRVCRSRAALTAWCATCRCACTGRRPSSGCLWRAALSGGLSTSARTTTACW
jgi:hypothetical protein